TAPFDAPDDPDILARVIDQLPSPDMLLFSSDFPHWHQDGDAMLPTGLDASLRTRILIDNPRATYPRLASA
ncbi:MAG: amidohydrolase family protein, partial [Hyphomicrobiaceae bacterium]